MATRKWKDLRGKMAADAQARAAAITQEILAEMPLAELRKARELTQATLAKTMGIAQGDVSKIENRADVYVSTLRSFINAMNGELEITARFPDGKRVLINQFSEIKTGTDG
jgi:DNA-binding XRE family transcriptional regulator